MAASLLFAFAALCSAQQTRSTVPGAWAGDWEGVDPKTPGVSLPADIKIEPAFDAADPLIVSHLNTWGRAKREATSYDNSPGSLCDPEGWFPFINYGYGFALLASPGKITFIPLEPDTQGMRRAYFVPEHPQNITPTWNGNSIARWEGDSLVIDTIGYNALSWLGDDREPHTTALHMVERMRLLHDGKYLEINYQISDPGALTSPYSLTRYFTKFNASHLGAGPDRNDVEWVCNEDLSPFSQEGKKAPATK